MFVTQQEPIIAIIILSLILFNPWMFLLCVFVYLRGSQTAVSDMTSWICFPFKRDIFKLSLWRF